LEVLKQLAIKLFGGFVLGIGFIAAAGIFGSYAISHIASGVTSEKEIISNKSIKKTRKKYESLFRKYDETAKLSVQVKTEEVGNGSFKLLGELKNSGMHSWSGVKLQADLYNNSGQFIEQCEKYISNSIDPGKTVNFKLVCSSRKCSKLNLNDYNSYKLNISNARYVRKNTN